MTYCPTCGAETTSDRRCRFAVPREEAPWLAEPPAGRGPDRELGLPVARWLLHHPEAAAEGQLEWARRTAGIEGDPPRSRSDGHA